MIVYADILFAINFSMDFISLFITLTLLNRKVYKRRILFSAVIGGLYGVFDLLYPMNIILSVIVNLAVSFIMCFVTYKEKSKKRFLSLYIVYWGVSLTLAGFMSVLYSFLNKLLSKYIIDYSYNNVYNGARFFVISSFAILITIIFGRIFAKEKSIVHTKIKVTVKNKEYLIDALCDSGNTLSDPLSGRSVILVSNKCELGKNVEMIPDIFKKYIPYQATNTKGLLKGIIPDKIEINERSLDAIIAPVDNQFAGYEGCVPYSLI